VRTKREAGIALITALLILFLVSAIIVGMSWMVVSDQKLSGNNQQRELAFYAAEAGMEKMTADMGTIFAQQGSIIAANIPTITGNPPVFPPPYNNITYTNALGVSTYQIGCPNFPCVTPAQIFATVQPPSAYAGMQAQITPFTLEVAAQTTQGAEVKLERQVELVAIPVFQFGVFSNTDLSFFNGPPFDFGGRVHTNGNLWLAANQGPVYFRQKITVAGQVLRSNLENGQATVNGGQYGGDVVIAETSNPPPAAPAEPASPYQIAGQWWPLALTEGSMAGPNVYNGLSGTVNNPTWTNTVVPRYNGMISIGDPQLNLISTALGGLQTPVALIRRPLVGEAAANPAQFAQRYFTNIQPVETSLRILLDDYPNAAAVPGAPGNASCVGADMMSLDSVSATVPVDLASTTLGGNATQMPESGASNATNYTANDGYWQKANTPIITGCLKVEYLNAAGVATDVTNEFLAHGYIAPNTNPAGNSVANSTAYPAISGLLGGAQVGTNPCGNENSLYATSIIRFARIRDNPHNWTAANHCVGTGIAAMINSDYWPLVLHDEREAVPRDESESTTGPGTISTVTPLGNMYYVELDIANLDKWFLGTLGAPDSGGAAYAVGGYSIYFSDRRGNAIETQGNPASNAKVASLGYNDFVNPASLVACPNGVLDSGEDLEGDGVLRTYGGAYEPVLPINLLNLMNTTGPNTNFQTNPNCAAAPSPLWKVYKVTAEARENPPFFFRHALKLVNGSTVNLGTACYGAAPNPPCGLTIASENPVYIQGDFNAPGGNVNAAGTVAASVAADAVTLLSDNWNDVNSYISPYNNGLRNAVSTEYRVAIIAGKQIPFAIPPGEGQVDFGTDGGLHNFLRYIENWAGDTLTYEGSLVSFYFSRQAIGLYKGTPYSPPSRQYAFDNNFTQGPQWLPPRTPSLRTVNTIGFSQMLMPTQ
jgi:Tfp pilus assembly protein PilV